MENINKLIKLPEFLKSSKGDGSLARTVKGLLVIAIFVISSNTAIDQVTLIAIVNEIFIGLGAIVTVYGLILKVYNRATGLKK